MIIFHGQTTVSKHTIYSPLGNQTQDQDIPNLAGSFTDILYRPVELYALNSYVFLINSYRPGHTYRLRGFSYS